MEKGISLYLAIMVMGILLAVVLGASSLAVSQVKIIREMGNSIIAFYAADTGIERELYEDNPPGTAYEGYLDLNGNGIEDDADTYYNVSVIEGQNEGCPAQVNYCIKSIGRFKEVRRAIQVMR